MAVQMLHPLRSENVAAVETDELRIELAARTQEHAEYAAQVRSIAWRIGKLLEADLPVEAHQLAGGLFSSALRRLRQLDGDAA